MQQFLGSASRNVLLGAIAFVLALAFPCLATEWDLEKVSIAANSGRAFSLINAAGTETVDLSELEKLDMYRVSTTSPWEPGNLTFEGPLLADVMTYLGLDTNRPILLRALDGFTAVIPPQDWSNGPVVLATRQDGQPMNRRMQGPTRVIYPEREYPQFQNSAYKSRWVWLIATIEQSPE